MYVQDGVPTPGASTQLKTPWRLRLQSLFLTLDSETVQVGCELMLSVMFGIVRGPGIISPESESMLTIALMIACVNSEGKLRRSGAGTLR